VAVEIGTLAGVGAHVARAKKLESCESEPRSGNKAWSRKDTRVRHDLTASVGTEGAESGSE
jgi:hypothetical protein